MDKLFIGGMLLMWFAGMPVLLCGVCKILGVDADKLAKKFGFDLGLWAEKEPEGAGTPTGSEF